MNNDHDKQQLLGGDLLMLAEEDARLRTSGRILTKEKQLELTEVLASRMTSAVWPILDAFFTDDPEAEEIARDAIAYLKMDIEVAFSLGGE